MRIQKLVFSSFIVCFALFSVVANADTDPVKLLQQVANHMIAALKSNKANLKTKPSVVYDLANRYVVPNAAITQMAQHVLPPNIWNHATPAQRTKFEKEFTSTLIRTYARALAAYDDQKVKFYEPRVRSGNTVVVNSVISGSSGQNIRASYRLIRVDGTWKLFDLSVEGVSMLESFRSQFSDILSQGSMDQLLKRLAMHNQRRG